MEEQESSETKQVPLGAVVPLKKKYLENIVCKKTKYISRSGNKSGIIKRKKQHKNRGRCYKI